MSRTAESASTEQHQAHRLLRLTHINTTSSSTEVYDVGRLLEIITSTLLHHHSYTPSRRTCWQGLWFFTQLSPSTVFHSHSGRSEPSDPQFPARNLSLKKWLVFCLNTLQGFPHHLKVFNLAYQPQKGLHLLLHPKRWTSDKRHFCTLFRPKPDLLQTLRIHPSQLGDSSTMLKTCIWLL